MVERIEWPGFERDEILIAKPEGDDQHAAGRAAWRFGRNRHSGGHRRAGNGRDVEVDGSPRVALDHARLALLPEKLTVDFGQAGRGLSFDVESRKLSALEGGEAYAARAIPQVHGGKPLVHWLVDTVRAEVGPEPIAWLENLVFGAQDELKRTAYSLFASKAGSELKADLVLLALGEDAGLMTGEAASRASLDLPGNQHALLERVAAAGKPTALVLFSGRPLAITSEASRIPAIVSINVNAPRKPSRVLSISRSSGRTIFSTPTTSPTTQSFFGLFPWGWL